MSEKEEKYFVFIRKEFFRSSNISGCFYDHWKELLNEQKLVYSFFEITNLFPILSKAKKNKIIAAKVGTSIKLHKLSLGSSLFLVRVSKEFKEKIDYIENVKNKSMCIRKDIKNKLPELHTELEQNEKELKIKKKEFEQEKMNIIKNIKNDY